MLTENRRLQLDKIVGQMTQNRESGDAINFVVNDFKNKYSTPEPTKSFSERTAGILDLVFGGGKIGEAIGTGIAKGAFGDTIQRSVTGLDLTPEEESVVAPAPSKREIAGSALQSASLFIPAGTIAKGITGGARALGLVKGASALGKISSGVLAGEAFDVASNLQQGKIGREALTPGLGALIGGAIPGAGVAKNVLVRFGERQAPRVINSLIKPLAKDFAYGKNPGRAIAEEGIVANNFDDLITSIRASRQKIGQSIGTLGNKLSKQPLLNIKSALSPLDEAAKSAASQNNQSLLARLNNVKRAITEVLEPTIDDAGNLGIKSLGSRDLENITFEQARKILGDVGDLTAFTGNPTDDKLVNSALKQVYGKIKGESISKARAINPQIAKEFEKLTEKYADLSSAEIATKYRDKIMERQDLIGFSPRNVGIGAGLITAVATGGATIPSVLVGVSAGAIDKLASTPGFKTRLAFILSKKTQPEVNYLFKKVPALSRFFSTKKGITPGDVLIGKNAKKVEGGISEFIKNPKLGLSIEDVSKKGGYIEKGQLTTKVLQKLEGRTSVSKQFISDLTNAPDLKQTEKDIIRQVLETEGANVDVPKFAEKVKGELLPLKRMSIGKTTKNADMGEGGLRYEGVALPDELRGQVKNYDENIYRSPIKTSAGQTHFSNVDTGDYFGHTRIEDMADNKTRRVIEVQSDLYQKGNLEREGLGYKNVAEYNKDYPDLKFGKADRQKIQDMQKLQQYNDPTAHFRMVREEIKKASQDGKTKLQFPTGETAMKIEGLGTQGDSLWHDVSDYVDGDEAIVAYRGGELTTNDLKVGQTISKVDNEIGSFDPDDRWIITDVLGDGKFKAIVKDKYDDALKMSEKELISNYGYNKENLISSYSETFDISGKVDTSNPIYKFYEKDMGRYLTNKYGAKTVVDKQGVKWYEVPVKKEWAKMPVEAFGLVPFLLGEEKDGN